MDTDFLNVVILAANYDKLVAWYKITFDLDTGTIVDEDYH
jgi:hypothetical protein